MKLAVSGKGGVGKTTFAALLIRVLEEEGRKVLAIDADPDANLAAAVGIADADRIVPIAEMKELIHERTETRPGATGGFFTLNPRVDDLPETLSARLGGIRLMKLGGVKKGGGGCICPESTLLRALVTHVVLARDEAVVMDMEAGIEHLGRATAGSVDCLIIVVEPGRRGVETALRIRRLASDIGVRRVGLVGNKIREPRDRAFLEEQLGPDSFLGWIAHEDALVEADRKGISPFHEGMAAVESVREIARRLSEMG